MQEETSTTQIEAIILDLGGVIINIDYSLTAKAFKELSQIENFDTIYSQYNQQKFFDLYETGKISSKEFRQELSSLLKIEASDSEFDSAWNAMILDIPKARLEYIKKLQSQGYRIFLLSNTNEIHLKKVLERCEEANATDLYKSCFEKQYYSHQLGHRKPFPDTFKKILDDNNLIAERTIFIDDTKKHVDGAEEAGIFAYHLDTNKITLETLLPTILKDHYSEQPTPLRLSIS